MKLDICDQLNTPVAVTSVFAIKKAKTAKNILDKRAFATSIAVLALQFLQIKKQRYVRTTGPTSY